MTERAQRKICSIDECGNPSVARRWCKKHYLRWMRHGDPLGGGNEIFQTPDLAFEARTIPEPMSGCLIWLGCVNSQGYGQIGVDGKVMLVHRYAWEKEHGPIPDDDSYHGMCVLHRCDNPSCVNSDHLFIGSQSDNMADMRNKKRQTHLKGEANIHAKLTEIDIVAIRADIRENNKIAIDYDVTESAIYRIKTRKRWAHVK